MTINIARSGRKEIRKKPQHLYKISKAAGMISRCGRLITRNTGNERYEEPDTNCMSIPETVISGGLFSSGDLRKRIRRPMRTRKSRNISSEPGESYSNGFNAEERRISATRRSFIREKIRKTAAKRVEVIKSFFHTAKETGRYARIAAAQAEKTAVILKAVCWISAVVITVTCMTGLIASSPFGILLSEGSEGMTISEAVRENDISLLSEIREIRESSSAGTYVIEGHKTSWEDVLAVYAVKASTDSKESFEVLTMNKDKLKILNEVFHTMNRVSYTEEGDGEGKRLVITIEGLTAEKAADIFNFSESQKKIMKELLSAGNGYWDRITGGYATGMGVILSSASRRGRGIFGWPLPEDGYITSGFGIRSDPFTGEIKTHGGVDIAAGSGTPVLASADGTVIVSNGSDSWGGGYGFYVMIDHGGGYVTLYGHCSFVCVTEGQRVRKGEMIAGVGTTGNSTGDHLHFEIREDGIRQDPMAWFE